MQALRFGFHDLFRAPRLAFSLQRMWIQFLGMGVGYVFYFVLTYIGYLLSGFPLAALWVQFGLLPCLFACSDGVSWIGWLFYGLGSIGLFVAFLFTNTAVARATYMAMKGHPFYSWREAFSFAGRKWASVVIAPLSLFALMAMVLIAGFFVGLLGKIPYIGVLGLSLATILWFLAALFLLYIILVTLVSIWLAPAIIATSDEDAFEVVFQSFSLTWSQPWRVLGFQVQTLILALLSLTIMAIMGKTAVLIMNSLLSAAMGNDYTTLAYNGQALLQNALSASRELVEFACRWLVRFFYFSKQYPYPDFAGIPTTIAFSSWIYAGSLLFVMGWILAYGLSTYTVGNVLSYLSLRKRKDGENLLERRDKEEDMEESEDDKREEDGADEQEARPS
jgi:hypothetical protein